ncbi:MAG: hypothetical protein H6815_00375 [Phycisphaeraceae bacterium]|nr:hypothetical protein [Phycisphaeraceae bacterium]
MNKLSTADRVRIVSALVEGCSIRATSRMTGVAKGTVLKLLTDLGPVCAAYHDEHVVGLQAERVRLLFRCFGKPGYHKVEINVPEIRIPRKVLRTVIQWVDDNDRPPLTSLLPVADWGGLG